MRRIVLSLVVLCLCPLKAYAAGGDLAWAKRAGGADYERGSSIVALADGSALVTGYFGLMLGSSSATFGPGEAGETTLTSAGDSDIFIARYNPDGTLAWAKRAGGEAGDAGSGIAALADGSALVTGDFGFDPSSPSGKSATFGPGEAGETTLTSSGFIDIFIARYNPDGILAWAKRAGGAGFMDYDEGDSIAALADGSALVTGSFEGSTTFGPGEAGQTTLTSAGYGDIFIARYNPEGTLAWAKRAGGEAGDGGDSIAALADGSALVTGSFEGSTTFGPGEAGQTTLTSPAGDSDIFIARYNPDGTLAWAKRAGGTYDDEGSGIAALADGSALATGSFEGSATFGPGEAGETTLTSAGRDIFIARYNPEGTLAWAKRAGGTYDDEGDSIAALAGGSALVTGSFEGSATFGPGEAGQTTLTSAGDTDIFIAKFNQPTAPTPVPTAQNVLNGTSFKAGQQLIATFKVNMAIGRMFNVYAVIILPDGKTMIDMMTLSPKIKPVATGVPSLPAGFSRQLLSITIPWSAPKGEYELLVAFFDPNTRITGRQDAFLQVSAKFTIQ